MAEHKSKNSLPIYLLTGIFLLILCVAVSIGILIKPYEQLQTYLNIVFTDQSMKITPSSGVSGLVIQENEIETAPPSDQQEFYENGEIIPWDDENRDDDDENQDDEEYQDNDENQDIPDEPVPDYPEEAPETEAPSETIPPQNLSPDVPVNQ